MKKLIAIITLALLAASLGWAQENDSPPPPDPPAQGRQVFVRTDGMGRTVAIAAPGAAQEKMMMMGGGQMMDGGGEMMMRRGQEGGMMMTMRAPGDGKWWKNPQLAQRLGLSDDQVSKMEKIFQDHRLQLIDLRASLEKQEVILEPMINADHPDEQQTLAQIDKVAQARANLEKSNARMLFAIRNVLTPDQWKKLQTEREMRPVRREQRFRARERGFRMRTGGPDARPAPPPPAAPPNPNPPNP